MSSVVSARNIREEIQKNEERMEELKKIAKPVPNYIKYIKEQEERRQVVLHMESDGSQPGVTALHKYIREEMGKKEKVLEEVLDQTKGIRKSFDNFEKIIEKKNGEIISLKNSISEAKQEISNLKTLANRFKKLEKSLTDNDEELSKLKSNLNKTNTQVAQLHSLETKFDALQKAHDEKEREAATVISGLLEWQQRLDNLQKQQKMCKICRKEAKNRFRSHRSQER